MLIVINLLKTNINRVVQCVLTQIWFLIIGSFKSLHFQNSN